MEMIHKLRCILNRNRCCSQAEIDKQQLDKLVEQGAILVDVRSPQEFEEGHLEKAILLPEYEIRQNVKQVLPDLSQTIVVYCSTGHRGQRARQLLNRLGYKQVYNLYQGLENYN
jgi:phage shock protein E